MRNEVKRTHQPIYRPSGGVQYSSTYNSIHSNAPRLDRANPTVAIPTGRRDVVGNQLLLQGQLFKSDFSDESKSPVPFHLRIKNATLSAKRTVRDIDDYELPLNTRFVPLTQRPRPSLRWRNHSHIVSVCRRLSRVEERPADLVGEPAADPFDHRFLIEAHLSGVRPCWKSLHGSQHRRNCHRRNCHRRKYQCGKHRVPNGMLDQGNPLLCPAASLHQSVGRSLSAQCQPYLWDPNATVHQEIVDSDPLRIEGSETRGVNRHHDGFAGEEYCRKLFKRRRLDRESYQKYVVALRNGPFMAISSWVVGGFPNLELSTLPCRPSTDVNASDSSHTGHNRRLTDGFVRAKSTLMDLYYELATPTTSLRAEIDTALDVMAECKNSGREILDPGLRSGRRPTIWSPPSDSRLGIHLRFGWIETGLGPLSGMQTIQCQKAGFSTNPGFKQFRFKTGQIQSGPDSKRARFKKKGEVMHRINQRTLAYLQLGKFLAFWIRKEVGPAARVELTLPTAIAGDFSPHAYSR